jgi:penicillin-binding protein-related factor A (putative recombinase)
MNQIEHEVQKSIKEYLDARGFCWWAVPNGGQRNVKVASKLQAEGVKKGVPDITLIYEGMFFALEVKKPKGATPKGYLSKAQKSMIKKIETNGGQVKVVYSVADVIEALIDWDIKT